MDGQNINPGTLSVSDFVLIAYGALCSDPKWLAWGYNIYGSVLVTAHFKRWKLLSSAGEHTEPAVHARRYSCYYTISILVLAYGKKWKYYAKNEWRIKK